VICDLKGTVARKSRRDASGTRMGLEIDGAKAALGKSAGAFLCCCGDCGVGIRPASGDVLAAVRAAAILQVILLHVVPGAAQ